MTNEVLAFIREVGVPAFTLVVALAAIFALANANAKMGVIRAETDAATSKIKNDNEALNYELARDNLDRFKQLNDQITEVERERNTIQADFAKLQHSFEALQKTADNLQAENTRLTERVAVLEKQLAESQTTINKLLTEIASLQGTKADEKKLPEEN